MKSTQNTTTATRYPHSHQTYGGEIYPSDFDTDSNRKPCRPGSSFMASRIASDFRFDERCKRNTENRQRIALYHAAQTLKPAPPANPTKTITPATITNHYNQ